MNSGQSSPTVVILISGRGGNMRALIEHSRRPGAAFTIAKVLSDRPAAGGLAIARDLGVPAQALSEADRASGAALERALAAAIGESSPSLIVLAGFMRILSPPFVARFAGKILNIHPSLLPKFPGLHTHRRALQEHESQHGATVHFVTEQLDGGPAVIQARVAVSAQDDEASLAARVRAVEHRIYPLAVQWFCEDRLRYDGGHAWLDGRLLRGPVLLTETTQ